MDYSHSQWIMFFFCYSVLGWIWEVCYEGLKQHLFLFLLSLSFFISPYSVVLDRMMYNFLRMRYNLVLTLVGVNPEISAISLMERISV